MLGDESLRIPLPWQTVAWQNLQDRRAGDRLPHALLFRGPAGTGKSAFANHLARSLVCATPATDGQPCGHCHDCQTSLAGSHPDLVHIEPAEPGKAIRVDSIRELIRRSVLTAEAGGYRVFIIEPADALNAAAANALLKTLEEPVPGTLFVLLTSRPDRLPATIRSRCQAVTFAVPKAAELEAWIAPRLKDVDVKSLSDWCGRAPLIMLETAAGNGLNDAAELLSQLDKLKRRQLNPLHLTAGWAGIDAEVLLDSLGKIVSDLIRVASDRHAVPLFLGNAREALQSLVEGIDLKDLYRFMDKLHSLRRGLTRNFNMGMLLQDIVVEWLTITRQGVR